MTQKQSNKIEKWIKKRNKLFFILKYLGIFFGISILFFLILFIYFTKDLPRPEIFAEKPVVLSSRIYDRTGEILLYEIYGEEKRIVVSLDKTPKHLIKAILAAEDNRFFEHPGIDYRGIIRAAWANLRAGRVVQGGSTITQQLARTAFLTKEVTFERKTQEIVLTLELERRYTKNQILEWYLNHVPLGIAHGVGMASQTFFNKPVSDLSLAESAVLASLIRSPSRLSPFGPNKEELFIIKDAVLDEMVRENFITKEEAEEAKKEEINFATRRRQHLKAPHFTLHIQEYLINKYGHNFLRQRGLRIITSLDWELQQLAEQSIKERIEANRRRKAYNASLVAINPTTGHILALAGSTDWFKEPYPKGCQPGVNCLFDPKFNAATAGRQPGSAFKAFIYAAAFENNPEVSDKTIINDIETNFGIWGGSPFIPRNFDRIFRGAITLREALAQSLNIPAVKALRDLAGFGSFSTGIENSVNLSKEMGITTLQPPYFYGPSFALGVSEVSLIEMTSAYGVFATQGLKVPPVYILRIEDSQGNIIEENRKTPKRVLSNRTSQIINSILSDKNARAPLFGEGLDLNSNGREYNVAVKTGTTDDFRDCWTIGYTFGDTFNNIPLVVGVWAGNSDNSPTTSPGLILAAPIWKNFMNEVLF